MRDRLLEDFKPHINADYSYEELVTLRTAGRDIPDAWIFKAKQIEDHDTAAAKLQKAIAADLKAAEKAREDALKATNERVLPQLRDMAGELDTLKDEAREKHRAAVAAVREYRQAYRAAAGKNGLIRRTIKAEYGEPVKDEDGNPLPGQSYAHWQGQSSIAGARIDPPLLDPMFDQPLHRGL